MPDISLFTFNVLKVLVVFILSSIFSFFLSFFLIKLLYKLNFWKKEARKLTITGEEASVFYSLHKEKETKIPRGGGILVWVSVLFSVVFFYLLSFLQTPWWLKKMNFLSRRQTWLPLFSLLAGSLVGLIDDILVVFGKGKYAGKGLEFWKRFLIVSLIGLIGGLWFFLKLEWDSIRLPILFNFPEGIDIKLGPLIVPFFIVVTLASWAGGVIDGLDGLAGGVFSTIFGAFVIIAFSQGKIDLAAFSAAVLGALFTFLWYNIPPAKFFMGETGVLGLSLTMAVISFLTDTVLILPILAGIMVIEVGSVIFQLLSKKIRKKKIWLSTPIHHHLEAKGWKPYQITMRFWLLSVVFGAMGVIIALLR